MFVVAGLIIMGELISTAMQHVALSPLVIGIIAVEAGMNICCTWLLDKIKTIYGNNCRADYFYWLLGACNTDIRRNGSRLRYCSRIIVVVSLINALKPAKAWEDLKKNS